MATGLLYVDDQTDTTERQRGCGSTSLSTSCLACQNVSAPSVSPTSSMHQRKVRNSPTGSAKSSSFRSRHFLGRVAAWRLRVLAGLETWRPTWRPWPLLWSRSLCQTKRAWIAWPSSCRFGSPTAEIDALRLTTPRSSLLSCRFMRGMHQKLSN